jgi:hypothetical protein
VDGVFKVEGDLYQEEMLPGAHLIHLERAGYASVDSTITVTAGDTLLVTLTLRENLNQRTGGRQ